MLPSILTNLAIVVFAVAAAIAHGRKAPLRTVMRYFTALSNLLCAAAALTVAVCRICGAVPNGVLMFKYAGTAAVTVTLLTVLIFLGPRVGYKKLFSGPDLWLHLVCPVLAIVSLLLWDKPVLPFAGTLLGVLPVLLYGLLYLYKVVLAPEGRRWPDLYGFNRTGRWPAAFVLMLVGSFAASVLLRLA